MDSSLRSKKNKYIKTINKNRLKKRIKDKRQKILKKLKQELSERSNKILNKSKEEIFHNFQIIKKNKNCETFQNIKILEKSIKEVRFYFNNQSRFNLGDLINEFFQKNYFSDFTDILKNTKKSDSEIVSEIIWFFIALFSNDNYFANCYLKFYELEILTKISEKFIENEKFLENVK